MEPTTGVSPYHQMSEQHIRLRDQYRSQPHPVRLVHQSQTPGAHNPWLAEAHLEAHLQQAMVAVQALEKDRLQQSQSSQDLAASQPL